MDSKNAGKAQTGARAPKKKKQIKDELDRIKQAEKKKRRLEKALATSAAIRSELEKKKQKKREEQERLDEEGAAIAKAVALNVLLGDENTDDSSEFSKHEGQSLDPWGTACDVKMFMSGRDWHPHYHAYPSYATQDTDWMANAHGYGNGASTFLSNDWRLFSYEPLKARPAEPYCDEGRWDTYDVGLSAGLLAAQAVSSLQISGCDGVDTLLESMFR